MAPRRFNSFIQLIRQASSKSLGSGGSRSSRHHRRTHSCDGAHSVVDDASISSTLTVDLAPHDKLSAETTTTANADDTTSVCSCCAETVVVEAGTKKEVRFNLDGNVVHDNDMFEDEEDVQIRWYCLDDFDRFKGYSSRFGKRVGAAEEGNDSPCTYTAVLTHTYLACCQAQDETSPVLREAESAMLRQWVHATVSRHGVERNCVKYLRKQRRFRRQEIAEMVLELQQQCPAGEDISEEIREACEMLSRSSRLFARIMAEASSLSTTPSAVCEE